MRWDTYEHMYMIGARFCLDDLNIFLLAQFSKYLPYVFLQRSVYLFSTVLRGKNYVVLASVF